MYVTSFSPKFYGHMFLSVKVISIPHSYVCILGGGSFWLLTSRYLPHSKAEGLVHPYFRKGMIAVISDLLDWMFSHSLTGGKRRSAHAQAPSLKSVRVA